MRGTKFKEEALKSIDAPMGIFLDLYPLDKMSDDPKEAKKQARDAWFWSKILILRSIPFPMLGFTGWKKKVIHAICGLAHLGENFTCSEALDNIKKRMKQKRDITIMKRQKDWISFVIQLRT